MDNSLLLTSNDLFPFVIILSCFLIGDGDTLFNVEGVILLGDLDNGLFSDGKECYLDNPLLMGDPILLWLPYIIIEGLLE